MSLSVGAPILFAHGPLGAVGQIFAAITDDPPAEIALAGHDRCIIPIKPENVDAWERCASADISTYYKILDDRERPYYEYRMAA